MIDNGPYAARRWLLHTWTPTSCTGGSAGPPGERLMSPPAA
jgi:hypothetical protein